MGAIPKVIPKYSNTGKIMSDVQSTQKPKSVFEEIDKGVITGSGPGQTAAPAAPATSLDANTIGLLANVLQLMAAKEARELQKQESDLKANAQRERARVRAHLEASSL
jgi:hypothetical protein